ncbi:microfibril-associated glycoprotein 4-like [Clavelina lepadiformis]|uniref:microfibril-associated glycoprotein 4-like n=1 Tax=Clavelina lepadiformis TaxID=159417 RepID=UPI0040424153
MKQILIYLALLTTFCVTMIYCEPCENVIRFDRDDVVTTSSEQGGDIGVFGSPEPAGSQVLNSSRHGSRDVDETCVKRDSCSWISSDILRILRDLEDVFRPDSCTNSPLNGDQFLRDGLKVYCEDRWSVFQRRFDGSVNFQRTWNEYKNGFGKTEGEFWLGLETVHRLTRRGKCNLRIELQTFDDKHYWVEYSSFSVDSEADLYRIHVSGHTGNATEGFLFSNGQVFITIDKHENHHRGSNCAILDGNNGGWWYSIWDNCGDSWLNALWGENGYVYWMGVNPRPKATTMKFRCD